MHLADPPYGIKFGSNWQVSTRSRDVKDGKADQISREPEMVKASGYVVRWHPFLPYIFEGPFTIARDLLVRAVHLCADR